MSSRFTESHLQASVQESFASDAIPLAQRVFTLGIVGDFSGRRSRGADPRGAPPAPVSIDRDDIDDVLGAMAPELHLRLPGMDAPLPVGFGELDDLHPDALWGRLPLFAEMRRLRERAANARTWPGVAREMGQGQPTSPVGSVAQPPDGGEPSAPVSDRSPGGLLDLVLEQSGATPALPSSAPPLEATDFADYVRRIVAPHLAVRPDPRQAEMLAGIDGAAAGVLCGILHDPAYQELEALWRAVRLLVRRVETSSELKIYLVDATREELGVWLARESDGADGAGAGGAFPRTADSAGGQPWSVRVAAYRFGAGEEDLEMLESLARSGASAGAPWICDALPELVGCAEVEALVEPERWSPVPEAWEALRADPSFRWLGLALPRVLMRLPYGEDGEECESLRFEEGAEGLSHDNFLWGSGAVCGALLLARSFAASGWAMRPGTDREIGGLPIHLLRDPTGGTEALPCAEVWLTERAADRILEAGLMPLASRRDRDAVQLVHFQSAASPPAPLSGPWRSAGRER